ncbi:YrhB domain-containing protein [Spirillospora sp. CA-253888]
MIDREHAVRLVNGVLRDTERRYAAEGSAKPLVITKVIEHRLGWILHWQAQAFADSGDWRDMLIGTGPYLVDRHDGSVHFIPGTDYLGDLWEEDYEQRVKPPRDAEKDPWSDVPFATELRETFEREGRVAAIRLLRRHAPVLTMAQADQYVAAVAVGEHPSARLLELARPPEPFTGLLGITTVTGPNPASPETAQ